MMNMTKLTYLVKPYSQTSSLEGHRFLAWVYPLDLLGNQISSLEGHICVMGISYQTVDVLNFFFGIYLYWRFMTYFERKIHSWIISPIL